MVYETSIVRVLLPHNHAHIWAIEVWALIWRNGAYRVQQREEVLAGSVKVGMLVEGREVLAGR